MGQKPKLINKRFRKIHEGGTPFKSVNRLLRGDVRFFFFLFHILHDHLKAGKYQLLFSYCYKGPTEYFICQICNAVFLCSNKSEYKSYQNLYYACSCI